MNSDKTTFLPDGQLQMTTSVNELDVVEVVYEDPLIKKDAASTSTTISSEDIAKMPVRSAGEMAATVGGTYSKDDGSGDINVRGGRRMPTTITLMLLRLEVAREFRLLLLVRFR